MLQHMDTMRRLEDEKKAQIARTLQKEGLKRRFRGAAAEATTLFPEGGTTAATGPAGTHSEQSGVETTASYCK